MEGRGRWKGGGGGGVFPDFRSLHVKITTVPISPHPEEELGMGRREEGGGEGKDGEEAHSIHHLVITSSANISPEARHMYSPKVTCFYCEGYHMKQLKYMYIR